MFVVDASVWVARYRPNDLNHRESRAWLESVFALGQEVIGPTLLLPEVAGPISRASGEMLARRAVSELTGLFGVRLLGLGHDLSLQSARSAARLRLRGADAVYVALAACFGMPLVTWDGEQQERAARAIDVRTPSELLAGAP